MLPQFIPSVSVQYSPFGHKGETTINGNDFFFSSSAGSPHPGSLSFSMSSPRRDPPCRYIIKGHFLAWFSL